jgi:hypothetical protein
MKIPVPAFFQKTWFRRTAVTVAAIGAVAILYALTYHKPRNEWDDWFVSIEKNPKLATDTSHLKWADVTAPTLSPTWNPWPPDPKDWSLQKEKKTLLLRYEGNLNLSNNPYQSSIVYADADGIATLSDGTVLTLQDLTLTLYEGRYTFGIKDGKIVRLPEEDGLRSASFYSPDLEICLKSSKPLFRSSWPDIYDMAGSMTTPSNSRVRSKNELCFDYQFSTYYDTPLKFCISVNHGKPQRLTVPAKPETISTGQWGSFCYLGEASGILNTKINTKNIAKKNATSSYTFTGVREKRICIFTTDSTLDNEMTAILEDGREFPAKRRINHNSIMAYALPEEAGDVPVKSFVFTQYSEMSRVVFNIPSLIDFFPENKGIKNRFDVKIPKSSEEGMLAASAERLLQLGLGLDIRYLYFRPLITGWNVGIDYTYPNTDNKIRFDFAGKTYREALIEYIKIINDLKPEDVALDLKGGCFYVKMPLKARLLSWWKNPTLERWPWSDPGPRW